MTLSIILKRVFIAIALVSISGCGDYYHYGLESGQSTTTLKQTDSFFITNNFEFKSIIYRSADGNLTIKIQHPLHPIHEPELFISQVEFDLNDASKSSFSVESIDFRHETLEGFKVTPIHKETINMKELEEPAFSVLKYSRDSLTPELVEYVVVTFKYLGETNIVQFQERLQLVKRWSKIEVLINS